MIGRLRRRTLAMPPAAAALLALACGSTPAPRDTNRILVDGIGRSVSVPASPQRVVSLAPSVTETIYELGLGSRLVGVSDFCRIPAGAPPVDRVGGILNPSLEAIRALHPDLLVATTSGNDPALQTQAHALGVPLFTVHTPDVEATLKTVVLLADLLGEPAGGDRLASALKERLNRVRSRVAGRPPVRVLYIVWGEPLIVPGRPTFLTDALRAAGAASVTAGLAAAWPTYDLESAIASAPEAIVTAQRNRSMAEKLLAERAWAGVPAVKARRLLIVEDSIEQPGPQVVSGIEDLARRLYPEAFTKAGVAQKN